MSNVSSDAHVATPPAEYLAFTLGQEEYGIDIQKVSEIRSYETVTRIASAPAFIKGVVNLRGIIVPIVDMRIKLGLGQPSYDHLTVVIVLLPAQIKPAPDLGALNADYLLGLGTVDERMLILVDIDRLMSAADMG